MPAPRRTRTDARRPQYLDGITVNTDVLSGPNPLLVVNGKVNLNVQPVRQAVKPSVVEAAHMVETRRVSA